MGNTTVWKPATTSLLSNYYLMKILKEAGLPDGVINFIPGSGSLISSVILKNRELAGIHFTGSTATFNSLWKQVTENLSKYRSYPKLVGETGGKDFIFAHNSANPIRACNSYNKGCIRISGAEMFCCIKGIYPKISLGRDHVHIYLKWCRK